MAEARVLDDDHRVDERIVDSLQGTMLEAKLTADEARGLKAETGAEEENDDEGGETI